MLGADRWQENWLAASPPGAVRVELPRRRRRGAEVRRRVRALPAGTHVVLVSGFPWPRRRALAFAADAGLELEREYLAFPSASAPGCLIEDAPATVSTFVERVLVVPPVGALPMVGDAVLGLMRRSRNASVVRALALGRVSVGRRS